MRYIFIFLLLGICISGCEKTLEVLPENSLTLSNALRTPQDFESAINDLEQNLKWTTIRNGPLLQERKGIYADEVADWTTGWITNDFNSEEIVSFNTDHWQDYYQGIASANTILNQVDDAPLSEERKKQYKGQALFFKALFYLRIIQRWGDCILVRNEVILQPTPKTPWEEVATYAISLAGEAADLLPGQDKMTNWKGSVYTHKAIPAKGAAQALLAYLCAWKAGCKYFAANNNYDEMALWQQAEKACTAIIESGNYMLESDPETVCTRGLVENSPESIYETLNRGFEYELSMWDDMTLTKLIAYESGSYIGYPLHPLANIESITNNEFKIRVSTLHKWYKEGDLRKDAYFYKANELADQTGGYAWGYKYRQLTFDKNSGYATGLNQNKIWWRLADVYLLRAECRVRTGNQEGAIADLNQIRSRAGAPAYQTSEDNGDLRYTIFLERQKELFLEGHRYFDVIRNGYVNTELHGKFRTLSVQDLKDGALFLCIDPSGFTNNPLMRQNTYWFKRM